MAETTASQVADYIIHFSHQHGDLVTNLKLQKLVYYAQAWYLALYGKPLFGGRLEAWVHGPVQPTVYQNFKKFGWNPITDDPGEVNLPEHIKSHLNEVMEVYGVLSAYQLERLTHREAPWLNARNGLPMDINSEAAISPQDMEKFYRAMADEKENKAT